MKRMWTGLPRSARRSRRISIGRELTVLPRSPCSRASQNESSPSTPMVRGAPGPEKACVGHSTNFAKLKRKPTLTWYSKAGDPSGSGAPETAAMAPPIRSRETRASLRTALAGHRVAYRRSAPSRCRRPTRPVAAGCPDCRWATLREAGTQSSAYGRPDLNIGRARSVSTFRMECQYRDTPVVSPATKHRRRGGARP